MSLQMETPAAVGSAAGASGSVRPGKANVSDFTPAARHRQPADSRPIAESYAVAWVARRFGVRVRLAAVVAGLAGLGGAA